MEFFHSLFFLGKEVVLMNFSAFFNDVLSRECQSEISADVRSDLKKIEELEDLSQVDFSKYTPERILCLMDCAVEYAREQSRNCEDMRNCVGSLNDFLPTTPCRRRFFY